MNKIHVVFAQSTNRARRLAEDVAYATGARVGGRSSSYFVHLHDDRIEFRSLDLARVGDRFDRYWIEEDLARGIWGEEKWKWLQHEAAKTGADLGLYLSRQWVRYLITGE